MIFRHFLASSIFVTSVNCSEEEWRRNKNIPDFKSLNLIINIQNMLYVLTVSLKYLKKEIQTGVLILASLKVISLACDSILSS